WVLVEKDVIEVSQPRRRARAFYQSAVNGKDALAKSSRLLHLPGAVFGARRGCREHENHRVGVSNQVAQALLPVVATAHAFAIDEALKAISIECGIELIGKV